MCTDRCRLIFLSSSVVRWGWLRQQEGVAVISVGITQENGMLLLQALVYFRAMPMSYSGSSVTIAGITHAMSACAN